jgi:hypothetical protein
MSVCAAGSLNEQKSADTIEEELRDIAHFVKEIGPQVP